MPLQPGITGMKDIILNVSFTILESNDVVSIAEVENKSHLSELVPEDINSKSTMVNSPR